MNLFFYKGGRCYSLETSQAQFRLTRFQLWPFAGLETDIFERYSGVMENHPGQLTQPVQIKIMQFVLRHII